MDLGLSNKSALVLGGSAGLGLAIATALARWRVNHK
jgi:NAD(P)-dependent dehydrogenase (short-subunit alcohol dehydrogenase family)